MNKLDRRIINIVGYRRLYYLFSGTLLIISIVIFFLPGWGLKLGIDFTGGTLMEVTFTGERPSIDNIHKIIAGKVDNAEVTPVGDKGMVLRFKPVNEDEHQQILSSLVAAYPPTDGNTKAVSEDRFTSIGPTIGVELQRKAIWAIGAVLLAVIFYIAWAFRKVSRPVPSWQYGATAIVALFHDVWITVGAFVLFGRYLDVEVGTLFISALLTVLGFSVHDTIVVFDRVRENLIHSTEAYPQIVNESLNETMARSINTSATTLLVLFFVFLFGGESIRYFVLALFIGISFGTYSSIFVASSLPVSWYIWQEKRRLAKS